MHAYWVLWERNDWYTVLEAKYLSNEFFQPLKEFIFPLCTKQKPSSWPGACSRKIGGPAAGSYCIRCVVLVAFNNRHSSIIQSWTVLLFKLNRIPFERKDWLLTVPWLCYIVPHFSERLNLGQLTVERKETRPLLAIWSKGWKLRAN